MEQQMAILSLGRSVGDVLESLPICKRGLAIREIQLLEKLYGNLKQQTKLSLQLLRIEHYKMTPSFYDDSSRTRKYVLKTYGDAVVAYLASLPLNLRTQTLKKIVDIVDFFSKK